MKLCNFRPLVCLAIMVIVTLGAAMLSLWCAVAAIIGFVIVLRWVKVPLQFKVVAVFVCIVAVLSYVLTTYTVANPHKHSYDPAAGLRGVVLGYVRWYLPMFLSPGNAKLLYAMMFGDKSVLTWGLRSDFTAAGLAHMLAVSGLHVGLLFSVISLLLRWCRVPKEYTYG